MAEEGQGILMWVKWVGFVHLFMCLHEGRGCLAPDTKPSHQGLFSCGGSEKRVGEGHGSPNVRAKSVVSIYFCVRYQQCTCYCTTPLPSISNSPTLLPFSNSSDLGPSCILRPTREQGPSADEPCILMFEEKEEEVMPSAKMTLSRVWNSAQMLCLYQTNGK